MLVMAAGLAIWIGYNLLIERLPESEGVSIFPALTFLAALAYVGAKWIRGKLRDEAAATIGPTLQMPL